MSNKRILFILVLSIALSPLFSIGISLDEAVQMAVDSHLSLKQKKIELDGLKREQVQVWNNLYPSFSATGAIGRSNVTPTLPESILIGPDPTSQISWPPGVPVPEENGDLSIYDRVLYADTAGTEVSPWFINLNIQGTLTLNAAMFMGFENTRLAYRKGEISFQNAENQLRKTVTKAYYGLLYYRENLSLLEGITANAQRLYDKAVIDKEMGTGTDLSVLQKQVALQNIRKSQTSAEGEYRKAELMFKSLVGIQDQSELQLTDTLPDPLTINIEEIEQRSLQNRPEIQELQAAITQLRHTKTMSQIGQMTPSLMISAGYSPTLTTPFSENTKWFDDDHGWSDSGALTFALSLPVDAWLPGSKAQAGLAKMDDQIAQLEYSLQMQEEAARLEAETILIELYRLQESYQVQTATVELAQKSYTLTEDAFNAGLVNSLELESAEENLNEALFRLYSEKFQYINTITDYQYAFLTTQNQKSEDS